MELEPLAAAFLSIPEAEAGRRFLEEQRAGLSQELLDELGHRAEELRLENPAQALHTAEWMLLAAGALGEPGARAEALRQKGSVLVLLGEYVQSLACFAEARELRLGAGQNLEVARLQVGWTAALKNLGRYDEALEMGLQTRRLLLDHERWDWLANLEMNLGSIYRLTDRYPQAEAVYQECLGHFRQAGSLVGEAQARLNLSRVLACQDRFRPALELARQARLVFEAQHKWLQAARADLNLATLHAWMGHYQQAWQAYNQAGDGFRRAGAEMEVAIVDLYQAQLFLSLNLFSEAHQLAQGAESLCARLEMPRYVALAQYCQAGSLLGQGQAEQALPRLEQARRFFSGHSGLSPAALIDLERSAALRRLGRAAEAVEAASAAMEVFSRLGLAVRLSQARLALAESRLAAGAGALPAEEGVQEQARRLYRQVLDQPATQRPAGLAYRAHYGLGRLEESRHRPGAARRQYAAAIRQLEIIQRSLRVDEFKASFLDDKLEVYQAAVRLSLGQGRLEEAFSLVERAKSGALLDWLARSLELGGEHARPVDPEAWARLQQLKEEWQWHFSRLERSQADDPSAGLRGAGGENVAWQALRRVENRLNQAVRQLQDARYAELSGEAELDGRQLAGSLGEDSLLIEYFCLGDEIVALLLGAGGLRLRRAFPWGLREVRRSLAVLELSLKRTAGLDPAYVHAALSPLARQHLAWLYSALVAPLVSDLPGCRRLVILPHDILHYLPFQAFYDGSRYLIESYDVQYAPSAAVLARCSQAKRPPGASPRPALVLGYSNGGQLRCVAQEVEAVAASLAGSRLFQEEQATLETLRRQAGECRVVHIASHAAFRGDNPLFSYIKLAGKPLQVIDLYTLELPGALVTLSACETGLSQLKGGDWFGLARGCFYAGASSLVASQWQVDDACTARLMGEFYRRLQAGERPAAALRLAQLDLMSSPAAGGSDPRNWAPFSLVGADLPLS